MCSGRVLAWFVLAAAVTFPNLGRIGTHIAGDAGDALFGYSIVQWGADRLPNLFSGYWRGFFFAGANAPVAYSDTLLGVVPLFWLLRLVVRSPVLAFNLLWIGSWAASTELTYRLARRLVVVPSAATIAAVGFTYSTIRLGQYSHPQLVFGGPFIPLSVLLCLRLLDRPSIGRGAALGASVATTTLIAAYYGVLLLAVCGTLVVGHLVLQRRLTLKLLTAGVAAGLALLVVAGIPALQYHRLQRDPYFTRPYDAAFALHPGDLGVVPPSNRLLGGDTMVSNEDAERRSENFAFPGFISLALGLVGAAGLAIRPARRRLLDGIDARTVVLVVAGGAVAALLALGEQRVLGAPLPVFDVASQVLPGYRGIRALVRLTIGSQLALEVLAAAGAVLVTRLARLRALGVWVVAGLLVAGTVAERAVLVDQVRVPRVLDRGVYALLSRKPPGRVIELPMPTTEGLGWPLTEAPRMAAGVDADHPRLNGYSGWAPKWYPALAAQMADPTAPASVAELGRRRIRYVVIHTRPRFFGMGAFDGQSAARLADALRRRCGRRASATADGWVVELEPARCAAGR